MSEPADNLEFPQPTEDPIYFVTTVEFLSVGNDPRVDFKAVNEAIKDQLALPTWLNPQPGWNIEVLGATSCETVSNASPTAVITGFGREAPPEEEQAQGA